MDDGREQAGSAPGHAMALGSFAPAPPIAQDWALFLDLDGTLLDIAPTPDSARAPPPLLADLARASHMLRGALAIVTGRSLSVLDALLAPLHLAAAGEHGAEIRYPDGTIAAAGRQLPREWLEAMARVAAESDGVVLERKRFGAVLHYRQAPAAEARIAVLARALVATAPDSFEVLPARMAFEIRGRGVNKGLAVEKLMPDPAFRGRLPVFVGDDVTDEDGMQVARALGGLGLRVDASFRDGPAGVRRWLAEFAARAGGR